MAARASHVPATALGARWDGALSSFERDLERRAVAPRRRRRAYGGDLARFARWCAARAPRAGGGRRTRPAPLRRVALAATASRATSLARTIASLRAFYRMPARARRRRSEPGRAADAAQASARRCRTSCVPTSWRPCSTASPPRRRWTLRDRAMFELAYAAGLRAEELVNADGRLRRLRRRAGARRGQGLEDALRAGRRARAARARRATSSVRGPRSRTTTSARCCSRSPAVRSRHRTCAGACASGRRAPDWAERCTRTPCDTPSRRICWTAARTCVRSRSCSAIRASPQPRFTLG